MVYLTYSQLPFSPAQDNTYYEHRCQFYNLIFPNQRESQSAHTAFEGTTFCDKYLRSWYPNFIAATGRTRSCSAPGGQAAPTWARLLSGTAPRSPVGQGERSPPHRQRLWPRGQPPRALRQTSPRTDALGFKARSLALTTALALRRKPSARPRWPKPSLSCWRERTTPPKAEPLGNNYSFGTRLQLVNIKLKETSGCAWVRKERMGKYDGLCLSLCWPCCWIREGNWMLMK